jgi:hypothetical protein
VRKANITLVCSAAVGLILYFLGKYLMKLYGLDEPIIYYATGAILNPASFLCFVICCLTLLFMLGRGFRNRSAK